MWNPRHVTSQGGGWRGGRGKRGGVSRGLGIDPGGQASLHQGPRQAARGRRGAAAKRGAGSKGAQSKGTDGTGQDGTGEGDADEAAAADGRGAAKPATGTEDGGKEGDWSADRVGDTDQGGEGNEEMDGDEEGPGSMQPSGSGEVAGDGMDDDGADQAHDAADDDADDDDSAAHGQPDLLQPLSDASGGHAAIAAHAAAESGGQAALAVPAECKRMLWGGKDDISNSPAG